MQFESQNTSRKNIEYNNGSENKNHQNGLIDGANKDITRIKALIKKFCEDVRDQFKSKLNPSEIKIELSDKQYTFGDLFQLPVEGMIMFTSMGLEYTLTIHQIHSINPNQDIRTSKGLSLEQVNFYLTVHDGKEISIQKPTIDGESEKTHKSLFTNPEELVGLVINQINLQKSITNIYG